MSKLHRRTRCVWLPGGGILGGGPILICCPLQPTPFLCHKHLTEARCSVRCRPSPAAGHSAHPSPPVDPSASVSFQPTTTGKHYDFPSWSIAHQRSRSPPGPHHSPWRPSRRLRGCPGTHPGDAVALAARLLHQAEARGKPVTAGNVAYYAHQHA